MRSGSIRADFVHSRQTCFIAWQTCIENSPAKLLYTDSAPFLAAC
jgi:hypothetical protein